MPYGPNYFFLEAYDRLGHHLYPNSWTGREITEDALPSPETILEKRTPLDDRIEEIQTKLSQLQEAERKSVKEDKIAKFSETRIALIDERQEIHSELRCLYVVDENYRNRHATYRRRETTENLLVEALRTGKLKVILGQTEVVPLCWTVWQRS